MTETKVIEAFEGADRVHIKPQQQIKAVPEYLFSLSKPNKYS